MIQTISTEGSLKGGRKNLAPRGAPDDQMIGQIKNNSRSIRHKQKIYKNITNLNCR